MTIIIIIIIIITIIYYFTFILSKLAFRFYKSHIYGLFTPVIVTVISLSLGNLSC